MSGVPPLGSNALERRSMGNLLELDVTYKPMMHRRTILQPCDVPSIRVRHTVAPVAHDYSVETIVLTRSSVWVFVPATLSARARIRNRSDLLCSTSGTA